MRVKEPLNGFRKSQGHIIYHIAMLFSNYYYLRRPDKNSKEYKALPNMSDLVYAEAEWIKDMTRLMHASLIICNWVRVQTDCKENKLMLKLLRVFEIFFFMYSIMYQQYYVILYPPKVGINEYYYSLKFWMIVEIVIFYALITNAFLFLAFIQIRGMMGYKSSLHNQYRYKYDALDYYENDIEWLSFSTVPLQYLGVVLWWGLMSSKHSNTRDHILIVCLII